MCTTIRIDYDNGSVMGRNMDWDMEVDYHVLYYPAGTEYAKDLYHEPLHTKYRMVGVCFRKMNPLKDGVNEHGLMGATNMFLKMNLFSGEVEPGKINISSLDYMNYALSNYRNIQELVDDLPNIHISRKDHTGKKAIVPEFHYYFVDAAGHSIIIEPDPQLKACEDKFGVMTNSPPLATHARRLEKTLNPAKGRPFHPAKDLPGGYDPVSRFIKAYYITENSTPVSTRQTALQNAYSVLEALKVPEGFTQTEFDHNFTRYTSVYDNQELLLSMRSHTNPRIFSVALKDLEHLTEKTFFEIPRAIQMDKLTS